MTFHSNNEWANLVYNHALEKRTAFAAAIGGMHLNLKEIAEICDALPDQQRRDFNLSLMKYDEY